MDTPHSAQSKLYIGIDIHKRSWKIYRAIALFSSKTFTIPSKPELLRDYADKYYPDHVPTVYEAGCCGYYVHRNFEG